MSDDMNDVTTTDLAIPSVHLMTTHLSGTTFNGRQAILADLKTTADDTTLCVLRESEIYDGVEVLLIYHEGVDVDPPKSLGWIPMKSPDQKYAKGGPPRADSPLMILRRELDRRGLEIDDADGIYKNTVATILDVPRGGKTYGCSVAVWDESGRP